MDGVCTVVSYVVSRYMDVFLGWVFIPEVKEKEIGRAVEGF
uniref:Uncharacterized protein n=1 Tax=Arundo donax TaxID=35708 RepID=A0A0A9EAM1_ARUDO